MIRHGKPLRSLILNCRAASAVRSIYIPPRTSSRAATVEAPSEAALAQFEAIAKAQEQAPQQRPVGRPRGGRHRRTIAPARAAQAELNKKLVQVEQLTKSLEQEVRLREDQALQNEKLAQLEREKQIGEEDIDAVLGVIDEPRRSVAAIGDGSTDVARLKTSLFESSVSTDLPAAIADRLSPAALTMYTADERRQDWKALVANLQEHSYGLAGVSSSDFSYFLKAVPLSQRADVLPVLHEMASDAEIKLNKRAFDLTMAAYAHRGDVRTVTAFMDQMRADGIQPDAYTYGHLLKAHGKRRDLAASVTVLKQMQIEGVPPSLPLYTTLMHTCIKVQDYAQAFEVFDMMKFLGTSTNPDRAVYSSVIYAAAKTYNIERALDLYREMCDRGIEPDVDTYANLIYTCARAKKTHVRAWELLVEMRERGLKPNRNILNQMLYLCGATGELSFARAIFRQLCTSRDTYPDAFSLTCLLTTYANYNPGVFSPVLATAVGPKLRAAFFFNMDSHTDAPAEMIPPFLPQPMLLNKLQVLAESRALFKFFKDMKYSDSDSKFDLINDRTVYAYLTVPDKLTNEEEFMFRWRAETCVARVDAADQRTPRTHHLYTLAISSFARNQWSYEAARGLWVSRGEWRRHATGTYRLHMTPEQRRNSDFLFARGMVAYLARTERVQDALDVVVSSAGQFAWRAPHVQPLMEAAQAIEDKETLRQLRGIVAKTHRRS